MRFTLCLVIALFVSAFLHANERSFVSTSDAPNQALLIAAANGLSGLDYDIDMVEKISTNTSYAFKVHKLIDDEATTSNAKKALEALAEDAGSNGTLFFYFTGHGSKGSIYMGDQTHMTVANIREGIEAGRKNLGPVERLLVMYDSCYSGSMVDPLRTFMPTPQSESIEMANALIEGLTVRGDGAYWKNLFVFASSTADETSMASSTGSHFTKGLRQGFEETLSAKGNMAMLADLTKKYTVGHHPVERFAPATMAQEKLVN